MKKEYKLALEYFYRALDVCGNYDYDESVEEKEQEIMIYAKISDTYVQLGDSCNAVMYLGKMNALMVSIPDNILFSSEIDVVNGTLYQSTGEWDKALMCFEKALRKRVEKLGEGNPQTAIVLFHIGVTYKQQGNYSKAKGYFLKTRDIQKKYFDPSNANLYSTCKELDEIEQLSACNV